MLQDERKQHVKRFTKKTSLLKEGRSSSSSPHCLIRPQLITYFDALNLLANDTVDCGLFNVRPFSRASAGLCWNAITDTCDSPL